MTGKNIVNLPNLVLLVFSLVKCIWFAGFKAVLDLVNRLGRPTLTGFKLLGSQTGKNDKNADVVIQNSIFFFFIFFLSITFEWSNTWLKLADRFSFSMSYAVEMQSAPYA